MSLKVILLALTSLALGIAGAAAILRWSKPVGIDKPHDLVITARGLDEFGIRLEVPYKGQSPHHILLLNDSQYHIIACQIVFEFVTPKGEIYPARKVVAYSELLNEKDNTKRKALLKTQPGIAPRTKWMIAMGLDPDLVLINDEVPALPDRQPLVEYSANKERFTQVIIKLDAVVLDTGEAVGPGRAEFLEHLRSEVLKETDNAENK